MTISDEAIKHIIDQIVNCEIDDDPNLITGKEVRECWLERTNYKKYLPSGRYEKLSGYRGRPKSKKPVLVIGHYPTYLRLKH